MSLDVVKPTEDIYQAGFGQNLSRQITVELTIPGGTTEEIYRPRDIQVAYARDPGTFDTTSETDEPFLTGASAEFVNCPAQSETDPLKVVFRLNKKDVVIILATFVLVSDSISGEYVLGSLYLDDSQQLPEGSAFTTTMSTLHIAKELDAGLHEVELRARTTNALAGGVIVQTPRITVTSQSLIKI